MRSNRLPILLTTAAVLTLMAGCQTLSPNAAALPATSSAASGPPANPATRAAQTRGNLAAEQRRLAELFRGTPVSFALTADGSLRSEIPLSFSFDPGKSVVKAPLAAVLDRIATSQAQELTKVWVAASSDTAAPKSAQLAADRAAAVRLYLIGKGIAATRVNAPTLNINGLVRILLTDASGS